MLKSFFNWKIKICCVKEKTNVFLLRRGYKVYVGKVDDLEVDFVAENRDGLTYYQVALTVRDNEVLTRELKSLKRTGDYYPKILLTLDMDLESDYNGITKINIIDWLLK